MAQEQDALFEEALCMLEGTGEDIPAKVTNRQLVAVLRHIHWNIKDHRPRIRRLELGLASLTALVVLEVYILLPQLIAVLRAWGP